MKPPKASKNVEGEVEEVVLFDILDAPRVILHEGKVLKKTQSSVLISSSRRHMILLNDVLLVASFSSSGTFGTSEKYTVHQTLPLEKLSLVMYSRDEGLQFEVVAPDRSYVFAVEREEDRNIWIEELSEALLSVHNDTEYARYPGWQHEVLTGTLHSAALLGDQDMLAFHLQRFSMSGESVDIFDDTGMCPVHWAALRGHRECVNMLLDAGADVDVLNSGLNSPLLLAGSRGNDDVLRLLIDRNADVNIRNLKDRDALFMSVLYAHSAKKLPSVLNTLNFQGVDLDQLDSTGAAPLHECAARNLPRPVQLLVDAGAAVNTKHGRSGITPLQVACSAQFPDPETVRSFLDKGGFPNWLDSHSRSAFEMVLHVHEQHCRTLEMCPEDHDGMTPIEYIAQSALPVLMEIVKKGGRYSDNAVKTLRPSFRDSVDTARTYWGQQSEPEFFHEFISAKDMYTVKPAWTADSAFDFCLLCVDKFNFSNRKHHCRACGILCCAVCSTKRLVLVAQSPGPAKGKHSPVTSPKDKNSAGERVCDGCFNSLAFQAVTWQQRQAKARRDLEKLEDEARAQTNAEARAAITSSPVPGGAGGSGSSSRGGTPLPNGAAAAVNTGVMNETRLALQQRGERISEVRNRAEDLAAVSLFSHRACELCGVC